MIFEETKEGIVLRVRLSPNSSSCGVKGKFIYVDGKEYLKIGVLSVPENGKANKELIDFLAKEFRLAKSDIKIISGEVDRYKKVLVKEKTKTFEDWIIKYDC